MDYKMIVSEFMSLAMDYEPDDCDDASFALIQIKHIGERFFEMQFNVNDPKDFIPHIWLGVFMDIGQWDDDIQDSAEMAQFLFDWAVEYREKHIMKFIENAKRFESIVER